MGQRPNLEAQLHETSPHSNPGTQIQVFNQQMNAPATRQRNVSAPIFLPTATSKAAQSQMIGQQITHPILAPQTANPPYGLYQPSSQQQNPSSKRSAFTWRNGFHTKPPLFVDGPSQPPGLEWTPTSRASGFLSNRGVVPAHDPCELLRTGDVESNPGPSCSSCNVTLRSGAPSLECSETGCTARCHKKKECSGMSRYGSQPEWRCRSHGGTVVEPPTAIPARPSGTCICCMGIVRPHKPGLTCSEPECQVTCHKKCSKRSRYATGDWSCPQHDTALLPPSLAIAGRELSSLSSSQPDPDSGEKRTCQGCKKTIARNTTGIACADCKGLFHKVCVGRRRSTRDEVEMYAGGLSWACCCVPTNSGSRAKFVPKGTLRLLQWNADGIKLKINELGERMNNLDVDIALMLESKLREKDMTPRIEGYSKVRADRRGPKPGGGLISFVKEDIAFESRPCWNQMTGNVESSRLKIRLSKKSWITLHNLYNPPNRDTNTKEVLVLDNLPADKDSFLGATSMATPSCGTSHSLKTAEEIV